jgi:DUF4097 and DUF4098 domain-containing protein YvlB
MKYTLGTAAKATGKSKTTILRAIDNHRISAEKNDIGHYQIDPAELHRVFPPKQGNDTRNTKKERHATPKKPRKNSNILQVENELLKIQLEREKESVNDLRNRLDNESEERRKLTMMITDQSQSKKTIFSWFK